jgi:hypothetical protein
VTSPGRPRIDLPLSWAAGDDSIRLAARARLRGRGLPIRPPELFDQPCGCLTGSATCMCVAAQRAADLERTATRAVHARRDRG